MLSLQGYGKLKELNKDCNLDNEGRDTQSKESNPLEDHNLVLVSNPAISLYEKYAVIYNAICK